MADLPSPRTLTRRLALPGGVLLGALVAGICRNQLGLDPAACWTAGLTAWCAVWWVLEPVPVPVTSIVPFVALPLAGVLDHRAVATAYGHTLILLLLGGFILSAAMERAGAHRRLAVSMVRLAGGTGPRRVVGGFMVATALCSMWISNTATTLMMLPVALAVLEHERARGGDALRVPLLLGIAWSASIGGLGTPVGTPPNVIFLGVYREVTGRGVGFAEWMAVGLPATLLLLPVAWLLLTRRLTSTGRLVLPEVGPWTPPERRVLVVFAVTALLWITRTAPFGGWSGALGLPGVGDSTVALAAVVAMFVLPSGRGGGDRLLDWRSAERIPWGLLLLFGGGIAIARAFEASGLAATLGAWIADDVGVARWPLLAATAVICVVVTFLTEVTSNTATTTLLMPVLAAAGLAAGIDPAQLMIPAALSASCAFMLPVATAPNAIVFGSGGLTTAQMARAGLAMNLVGAVVIAVLCAVAL
jgi:sodium-dependent dicarboxylate transporter 2/3/5